MRVNLTNLGIPKQAITTNKLMVMGLFKDRKISKNQYRKAMRYDKVDYKVKSYLLMAFKNMQKTSNKFQVRRTRADSRTTSSFGDS